MPVLSTWDSGKWKGRIVNWTHAFLPLNMLILTHYFLTLTCPVFRWLPSPYLYMNPISFWMLNTLVIITDYKCQNQNINSGARVGTGSAQSLESMLYSPWVPESPFLMLWTLQHHQKTPDKHLEHRMCFLDFSHSSHRMTQGCQGCI